MTRMNEEKRRNKKSPKESFLNMMPIIQKGSNGPAGDFTMSRRLFSRIIGPRLS